MRIYTSYSVKIKHYNHIFKNTVNVYRSAVDYLIKVCLNHWDVVTTFNGQNRLPYMTSMRSSTRCHAICAAVL